VLRVAVAGVPGAWSTERMAEALRSAGIESFVFSLTSCLHDLSAGTVTFEGFDLSRLDGIVVKKLGPQPDAASRMRLHMLRQLEQRGVRIYSRPGVIDVAMDRYRMSMKLIGADIPMPETVSCESEATLGHALERLGPAVAKPVYTSKARGMVRLDRGSANGEADAGLLAHGPVLVQRFVHAPGRDIGACVLGGRFVGAFYRVAADGQWVTSTSAGGRYAPCRLPREAIALAERATEACGLDYTVVDLVETPERYLVYEVSAFGGFRGLWEAERRDIATDYAQLVKWDLLG
jgi:ribosomal protein S6--L-glutamate ligase